MEAVLKFRWFLGQFKATFLSALVFIGVTGTVYGVLIAAGWQLTTNATIRNLSTVLMLPVSAIWGAVTVFLLTPWILRWSWPIKQTHEGHELDSFLTRLGRKTPRWIEVHSMPEAPFQAWATGLNSNWNFFRPAIFYTQSLKEKLSEESVTAVFLHEISHLALNHPFQRGIRSLLVFGASSGLVVFLMAASVMTKNLWALAAFIPILTVGSLYARMSFGKFVARQEFEADEFAVDLFGASPQALIDALQFSPLLAQENAPRVRALQQKYAGRIFKPDQKTAA